MLTADGMTSVYSGLECKYEDDRWDPDDGNASQDLRRDGRCSLPYSSWDWEYRTTYDRCPKDSTDGDYSMTVSCPLPSLYGEVVIVGVIDGTVFDDVTCRVQSCVVGLGIGAGGEGNCKDSTPASTHANRAGFLQSSDTTSPVTQGANYITQNISWIRLEAPDVQNEDHGARNEDPESDNPTAPGPGLGEVYTHLLCTLPEQDDVSPTAPGLASQMRDQQGISYIQSYYVDMMDDVDVD